MLPEKFNIFAFKRWGGGRLIAWNTPPVWHPSCHPKRLLVLLRLYIDFVCVHHFHPFSLNTLRPLKCWNPAGSSWKVPTRLIRVRIWTDQSAPCGGCGRGVVVMRVRSRCRLVNMAAAEEVSMNAATVSSELNNIIYIKRGAKNNADGFSGWKRCSGSSPDWLQQEQRTWQTDRPSNHLPVFFVLWMCKTWHVRFSVWQRTFKEPSFKHVFPLKFTVLCRTSVLHQEPFQNPLRTFSSQSAGKWISNKPLSVNRRPSVCQEPSWICFCSSLCRSAVSSPTLFL